MPDPLFVFFAALTLGGAALLVASRHPVTSAMGMIVALLGIAAEFFLLDLVEQRHEVELPPELAAAPETLATSAKAFGRTLWTKYTLPLQLAGLLLLAALVGVVSLSKAPRNAE